MNFDFGYNLDFEKQKDMADDKKDENLPTNEAEVRNRKEI